MRSRLPAVLAWGVPVLAVLMLAATLTPSGVWRSPADDATYSGFDPYLVMAASTSSTGAAHVSRSTLELSASSASEAVNLATTQLSQLKADFDAVILENTGAREPLRVGVWSPWTGSGVFVVFGSAPDNSIAAQTISNGRLGPTLLAGDLLESSALGSYQLNQTYHISAVIDRAAGTISVGVHGPGVDGKALTTRSRLPAMFGNVQLSISVDSAAEQGSVRAVLRSYELRLPHQATWSSRIADPVASAIVIVLAILGLVAAGLVLFTNLRLALPPRVPAIRRRVPPWVLGAIAVYLVGNALLFPLGGHPFDMGGAKLWAYVAVMYGPPQVYFLPNAVSLTWIWHGVPYIQSAFPYEPVSAYLATGIGWLNRLFSGGWTQGPGNDLLEYLIKGVNVAFALADALLIYAILRTLQTSPRLSLLATGLFLFNPAVWFSTSVWGQTHVFSLCFVLAAVLLAERQRPTLAWLALAAACLTRPQMLVFGLVLGIYFLRKFGWRQNVAGFSWAVIVCFMLILPFTLATSPSLPIDVLAENFNVQEAGGNVSTLTTVSQDGLSMWPLVTYIAHGASGLQRAFTPSSASLFDGVTYQRAGQILTLVALLALGALIALRRRVELEGGGYLPLVALAMMSFLMFMTGILATHFLLALPFLLLSYRWLGGVAYFYIVAIWTVTTFVPMYGDMGVLISSLDYPLLSPAHNPVTKSLVDLYASDRFITVGVVANVAVMVWISYLILRFPTKRGPIRVP